MPKISPSLRDALKADILHMLSAQGYQVTERQITLPSHASKEDLRRIHSVACAHKLAEAERVFRRHESRLLDYIADGEEVCPEAIRPRLVQVESESDEALLFRYACLHWTVPVSSGYGRRLRFLVIDESNGKLIGLFGLGDPVYSIGPRDAWIGWDRETKKHRLYHIMDAYVLGAVPPYSMLLCGKLVALAVVSNEVRQCFSRKYADHLTLIRGQQRPAWLALVTTTSALGRSSIYNRIRLNGHQFWTSLGYTQGTGEFHFSNGIYEKIRGFAEANCVPTAKDQLWGKGFRSKREVIKKSLTSLVS